MHVTSAPIGLDETRLPQDPEMLRDGPLCNVQSGDDGSHAQRLLLQQA